MKSLLTVLLLLVLPLAAWAQSSPGVRPRRVRISFVQGPRSAGLALSATPDVLVFLPESGGGQVTVPFTSIAKIELSSPSRVSPHTAATAGRTTGLAIFTVIASTLLFKCGETNCGKAGVIGLGGVAAAIGAGLLVHHLLSRPGWTPISARSLQSMIP